MDTPDDKPLILCLDIEENTVHRLSSARFNIFNGRLGNVITDIKVLSNETKQIQFDHKLPENIHEYDILLADLNIRSHQTYDEYISIQKYRKKELPYFMLRSSRPLHDERPFNLYLVSQELAHIKNRAFVTVVFASVNLDQTYLVKTSIDHSPKELQYGIYQFCPDILPAKTISGTKTAFSDARTPLVNLMKSFEGKYTYEQTFHNLVTTLGQDEEYTPLLYTINNDTISFRYKTHDQIIYVFPNLPSSDKEEFIFRLVTEILPREIPELFPNLTSFQWLSDPPYYPPQHSTLLEEKATLIQQHAKEIDQMDSRIAENKEHYQFLHDLLTETGNKLTETVAKFLEWLGFNNVKRMDDHITDRPEEDIQIETKNGLLVIEVKGIGGTSTDNDCAQVSKIGNRRKRERNKFDVFPLYIVNHQRYQPPLLRQNPPFSPHQIQDAHEERGLLTTWQLYRLYFNIESGIITKQDARASLFHQGLIEFKPQISYTLGVPAQVLKEGNVITFEKISATLRSGQQLLIEQNGSYEKCLIQSIMIDGKPVQLAIEGSPVGLLVNIKVKRNSVVHLAEASVPTQ